MPSTSRGAIPPPVEFDLDAAENARLRDAYILSNGGRLPMALLAFAAGLQSLAPIMRLYRYRGNDPFDWALLSGVIVMLVLTLTTLADPTRLQRLLLRPQIGTIVTFDDLGITVRRRAARPGRTKRIALAKIRSVRRTPGALFIFGRVLPLVTIPLRALPDGGAQIMSYFEDRLIATHLLRRSSSLTTIVNTTSP